MGKLRRIFGELCVSLLLFCFFWAAILSTLGQNGTLPASVKCVNLLFWAEILSALGQMALCQHLWSEIRNSGPVLVGRIFEASVWTTREWISKVWAKTIEFFLIWSPYHPSTVYQIQSEHQINYYFKLHFQKHFWG